jgi:AcrR family transcriptional regulator
MARKTGTSDLIVSVASKLFYTEGIRGVGMDLIAEKAGVTKRTLYYHFRSKDDLVAAYLASRDQPGLNLFQRWFEDTEGDLADKARGIFSNLAQSARHPKWKGCGFLRTTAELVNMPGHPAIRVGAAHKKGFEAWIRGQIEEAGLANSGSLARQVMLLLDGSFAVALLHRDPSYIKDAGEAVFSLIRFAQGPNRRR